MKKIVTLLFAVGTISIASAQTGNFNHFNRSATYLNNGGQHEVQQINREYDYKITEVKMDRHLNGWEKSKQIRSLENQRNREIAAVQFRSDKRMAKNTHRW